MTRREIFLIPGYGVPRDMATDGNYPRYLGLVFNFLFSEARRGVIGTVVMSGGASDMTAPYRRTEAGEMAKVMKAWATRAECREAFRGWRWQKETKAILSVENLVLTKEWCDQQGLSGGRLTLFVEATRAARLSRLARLVFAGWTVRVVPVDFDLSANRYVEEAFLHRREATAWRWEARACRDASFRRELHTLARRRLTKLREAGDTAHVHAVRAWWEEQLKRLEGVA